MIAVESRWRERPVDVARSDAALSIWTTGSPTFPFEAVCNPGGDDSVVTYACRSTDVQFWMAGRRVSNGRIAPQTLLVTGPQRPSRAIFKEPWRACRLYLPQSLIGECYEQAAGRAPSSSIVMTDAAFVADPAIEKMMQALLSSERSGEPFERIYTTSLSLAIAARLLTTLTRRYSTKPERGKLAPWRLDRVLEFIEANLHCPLDLDDLARIAGLTRMHFSAQFRAATCLPPHAYLLRRRVFRAQDLLINTSLPLAQIAIETGFRTQSHMTVVFKKVTGHTPKRWAKELRADIADR